MDDLVLILSVLGGLLLLTAPLPRFGTGRRVLSALLGLALPVWGGWVFLFGGWYLISFYVVVLPAAPAVGNVVAMFRGGSAKEASHPLPQGPQPYGAPPPSPYAQPPQAPPYPHPKAPYPPPRPPPPMPGQQLPPPYPPQQWGPYPPAHP
ncbi:hypothetical protein NI17_003715 [Thermobifida halotolerans]|uniref:Uncharacterized protein n=1 Tax=Thermobifida halotolerans TaxID=483545 RepID=A0AA97LYK3_9ACTN|nr:hypothetical protein [Thermobifida halotolerans]UOE20356.1 hypothetical protein NI17_003715 [Thermobifida halotolerans]